MKFQMRFVILVDEERMMSTRNSNRSVFDLTPGNICLLDFQDITFSKTGEAASQKKTHSGFFPNCKMRRKN